MSSLLFVTCGLFLFQPTVVRGGGDDYWAEGFNSDKNCQQEKKISKLEKSDNGQCFTVVADDDDKEAPFEACKENLLTKVNITCANTTVLSIGELMYCHSRREFKCCFENHSCPKDQATMQSTHINTTTLKTRVYKTAKEYLTDPEEYLNTQVRPMGYKTCHVLNSSLDATVCAKDCDRLKNETFATKCRDNKGLYKCCIRRDKAFCHECRFCCTLSLCTYPSHDDTKARNFFDDTPELKDQDQEPILESVVQPISQSEQRKKESKSVTASDLYNSLEHLYKNWDYRCLVPYSDKDPTKWKTYEMHDYRSAFSENTLKNVDQFKFDKKFFNWEDPKVLKYFAKNPKKAWKKTYGFPYVSAISWDGLSVSPSNATKCFKKCARYEHSKFAKKCRKEGGFFKCCVAALHLDVFEKSRNRLIEEGLIKDKPTHLCNKPGSVRKDPCVTCNADAMCTKIDVKTKQKKHTFMKDYKKEHRVGGTNQAPDSRFGIRFSWCLIGDLCYPLQGWMAVGKNYREVMSREDLCKVPLEDDWGVNPKYDKENMRKEYNEYCPKSKSKTKSNIVFCPREIIRKKAKWGSKEEVIKINDYFKKVGKESKKERTKKRSKRGKKKKSKKRSKRGKRKKTKKKSKKRSKKKKTKKKGKKKSKKKKTKNNTDMATKTEVLRRLATLITKHLNLES